jgi:hypothetical protein
MILTNMVRSASSVYPLSFSSLGWRPLLLPACRKRCVAVRHVVPIHLARNMAHGQVGDSQMTIIEQAEARKTSRRRVLDTGLIRFGDLSACCVIRNLSTAGAALESGARQLYTDNCPPKENSFLSGHLAQRRACRRLFLLENRSKIELAITIPIHAGGAIDRADRCAKASSQASAIGRLLP